METVTYFRNARRDGGVRSGIARGEEVLFHRFKEGKEDFDPSLDWVLDISFFAKKVPSDPEELRKWMLQKKTYVLRGLTDCAKELEVGLDGGLEPFEFEVQGLPKSLRLLIKVHFSNYFRNTNVSRKILAAREEWEEDVRQLPIEESVFD